MTKAGIKAVTVLLAAMAAAVLAARLLYSATVPTVAEPAAAPWALDRMEFVTWNDAPWTAWIHDGKFELLPREQGRWRRHSNATLAFIDWEGEPWQAKIDGEEFLLAARGDWRGQVVRERALRYRDWHGRQQLRTVAQLRR